MRYFRDARKRGFEMIQVILEPPNTYIGALQCRHVQQGYGERSSGTFESKAAIPWTDVEGTGWLFPKVWVGA